MNSHKRTKREAVEGWSESSTRRNTRFLYGVDERGLTGHGFALSLTIRDCPPTSEQWTAMRRAFFMRLDRLGMVRAHWLTEWQRRGVPHMHAAIWFPEHVRSSNPTVALDVLDHWMAVAEPFGAGRRGQCMHPITDAVGWFQYLSKHAVRGMGHYQRSPENIPAGWKKTGRMWGHLGDWPVTDPTRYTLDNSGFWAFRRMVQRWRLADARASGDQRRLRSARRMLQCNERNLSSCRGVSEWIGRDMTAAFVACIAAQGHPVTT
jgi:hypothetical protein